MLLGFAMLFSLFLSFLFIVVPVMSFASGPESWQFGLQKSVTDIMDMVEYSLNSIWWITGLTLLVVYLMMLYIIVRFRRRDGNETPSSKSSHNFVLEVVWTLVPVALVAVITINNVRLINYQNHVPTTEMTLKVIGYQWYWGYSYVGEGIEFNSYLKEDSDLADGDKRLLSVTNEVVLPIGTSVKLLVTAADVIHSWAVPAFGIKMDAVPGRLNEAWFNIKKPGKYYGQCSELCGVRHGFMPIVVNAVSKDDFRKWIKEHKNSGGG